MMKLLHLLRSWGSVHRAAVPVMRLTARGAGGQASRLLLAAVRITLDMNCAGLC